MRQADVTGMAALRMQLQPAAVGRYCEIEYLPVSRHSGISHGRQPQHSCLLCQMPHRPGADVHPCIL